MNTPNSIEELARDLADRIHDDYKDLADSHTGNDFNCSCPDSGKYETDDYCPNRTLKRTVEKIAQLLTAHGESMRREENEACAKIIESTHDRNNCFKDEPCVGCQTATAIRTRLTQSTKEK